MLIFVCSVVFGVSSVKNKRSDALSEERVSLFMIIPGLPEVSGGSGANTDTI